MNDLSTLIPADSGWKLVDALAINNRGQIVGTGVHNGKQAAFLLTPSLFLTPASQDFGVLTLPHTSQRKFTLKNNTNKKVTGTATTTAPFEIVSGGTFNLAAGATQEILVRFEPSKVGLYERTLTITSKAGNLTARLFGIGVKPGTQPPVIDEISPDSAVPGDGVTVFGKNFGPMKGQLTLGGAAVKPLSWQDTFIRFTVPKVTSGDHPVKVTTAKGSDTGTLEVLSGAPVITAVLPRNGAPGTTVVIDGHNFGNKRGASTVTVGGVVAKVLAWSTKRLRIKIPEVAFGLHPLVVTTAKGKASSTFRVRNLILVPGYGECDKVFVNLCPPVIISVKRQYQTEDGTKADIVLENLYDRWYEVKITPVGATVPGSDTRMLGLKQTLEIKGITLTPGANITFFADGTSESAMWSTAFDLLYLAATGSHLPNNVAKAALTQLKSLPYNSKLVLFFADLSLNIANKDKWAILKQIRDIPGLAKDPAVEYFLLTSLKLTPTQIKNFGSLSYVAQFTSSILELFVQLVLPRFAVATLVAE
jgi:hypothetical protein